MTSPTVRPAGGSDGDDPRPAAGPVVTDDFFGTGVPDPYRWLEDDTAADVRAWAQRESTRARHRLDALADRPAIAARIGQLLALPRSGTPHRRGGRWWRTTNDGSQEQDVLRWSATPFGDGTVLLDPNPLSADSSTSLAAAAASRRGDLVAYAWSEAGSDWRTWRVRDVLSGDDLADEVPWSKFTSPVWLPDGTGFVYGAFDAPGAGAESSQANRGHRIVVHRIGQPAAADEILLVRPDEPELTFWPEVTDDDRWLVVSGTVGTDHHARIWVRDLADESGALSELTALPPATWELIGSLGAELVFVSDHDAPRGRVLVVDPGDGAHRELVAPRAANLLGGVLADGALVLDWLDDAHSVLTVHDRDGSERGRVELPGLGTVTDLAARSDDSLVHLGYTSFTQPPSVLRVDVARPGRLVAEVAFSPADPPSGPELLTHQQWTTSLDGTRVPVFLTHRNDVRAGNGPHPALLYGYGGFRIPITPTFDPVRFAFAEAGGVVAVASLRGGGEFGADWHDAGRGAHKQNVFDDAIAIAEDLIATGWTSARRLAVNGRSNGGLLVGAVLTQRPELFAAAVPEVGVLDMLRFHRFTIGWAWTSDYGDPTASRDQFETLFAYSPYHRLRGDAAYPPTLILTSDHDDRVVPAHSYKFAARMIELAGPDDVLLRVAPASGHGVGRSRRVLVDERADVLAFIADRVGLRWPPG